MFREKLKPVTVASCRHRSVVSTDQDGWESATCALVRDAIGANDDDWHRVGRDACEACCRSFPPTAARSNPVLASVIHEASSAILRAGGVDGCDETRASAARTRAIAQMDLEIPEESRSHAMRPVSPAEACFPGLPPRQSRQRVRRWAVGVTTAPRSQETLSQTLESFCAGGWPDPFLFVDTAVKLPEKFAHLPGTYRDTRLGAWPNYYLSLVELLLRVPEADAYLVAQDDLLFPRGVNVREYLEAVLWPGHKPGLVSLYCSSAYTKDEPGWYTHNGLWLWGALAFVFSRELAREFVTDLRVFDHRRARLNEGLANIDIVIGAWAVRRGLAVWYPTPSLVQHIGDSSSIWPASLAEGPRRADWFAGNES